LQPPNTTSGSSQGKVIPCCVSILSVRVSGEVKEALELIAKKERRSLAQVCDLILKGGIQEYEKEGSAYLRRVLHSDTPKKPPKRS
jgi:hypothetical protein